MRQLPELRTAVQALPGVREATVRWPQPDGPAVLQVSFTDDADAEAVAREVLATAEQLLGIGADQLEVRMATEPSEAGGRAAPTAGGGLGAGAARTADGGSEAGRAGSRPVFSGLRVDRRQLETTVDVTLQYQGRKATGSAEGLATHQHAALTAAAAALKALQDFLPDDVRAQVEWLEVLEAQMPGRPTTVQVAVTCLRTTGEERHLGVAMVRGDLRETAVRATLDALNRPLQRLAAAT